MPVRAIKKIASHKTVDQGALSIKVPEVILDAFKIGSDHQFVCELKRHFDKEKKMVHEANETGTLKVHNLILPPAKILSLSETPLAQKYGLAVGDYIEIIFLAVEEIKKAGMFSKKKDEIIRTDIFPERMIDDLDFDPEK